MEPSDSPFMLQEGMRGVLDMNKAQQVDLNARVDGLTHRITAAIANRTSSPVRGSSAAAQPSLQPHPGAVTSQVSCQLQFTPTLMSSTCFFRVNICYLLGGVLPHVEHED